METSVHRQLKIAYAESILQTEVSFHGFRIDAIDKRGHLVEIQHAGLGALKAKTRSLLDHAERPHLRIVKPIVEKKWIITRDVDTGEILRKRLSPKRGQLSDIFMELVHFARLFPHPRLTIEVVLIDLEEQRVPKLKHRFRRKNYISLEQTLVGIGQSMQLRKSKDLWKLLPKTKLSPAFDTAQLAQQIDRPRWFAQKVAYCLKHSQAIESVGKQGNNLLYKKAG